MFDDVVGLVMVQIISTLDAAESSFGAFTVVRPIGVSFAFAIVVSLVCRLVVKPIAGRLRSLSVVSQRVLSKVAKGILDPNRNSHWLRDRIQLRWYFQSVCCVPSRCFHQLVRQ